MATLQNTYTTGGTRPDDLVKASERYNNSLVRLPIVVVRPFYWDKRLVKIGEVLSVPRGDARDLVFRGKAELQ